MVDERPPLVIRVLQRVLAPFAPREGWLSLLLVSVMVSGMSNAIVETQWTPEIEGVWLNGLVAALMATLLAKHVRSTRWAWGILLTSGVFFSTAQIGRFVPPLAQLRDGSWVAYLVAQGNRFVQRLHTWWERLQTGAGESETLPFTLIVGLAVWFVAAALAWQTYRTGQPLVAATVSVVGVAVAVYFSRSPEHWLMQVVIGAIGLVALMRFVNTQRRWEQAGIDYPANVAQDFTIAVVLFAVLFPLAGYATPRLAVPTVARAFADSPAVLAAERVLERTFPGVDVRSGGGAAGSGDGVLPRQHLLTGSPELLQSVVMTATVQGSARPNHWRALSYDNYTGHGWELSADNVTNLGANRPIPQLSIDATTPLTQTVHWLQDDRSTRYALGRPVQFDQPTRLQWHDHNDLVRVRGSGNVYQVQTEASVATATQLREVRLTDVPSGIIGRYTQLPDTVPQRVLDLAVQVTADATTPYDKAKALETFLRQYEYSLDIDTPPAERDVVDFFLFEQQIGYCDYYATAMTVLARHVGLPARTAIGFAATPTIDGTQTLRGIDAHSWTEIHFGTYGWIEFEPTGGFALWDGAIADSSSAAPTVPPPPAPTRSSFNWQLALSIVAIVLLVGLLVLTLSRLSPRRPLPSIEMRYAQLQQHAQRLAIPLSTNQTPHEFLRQFEKRLDHFDQIGWLQKRVHLDKLQRVADQLTSDYIATQYGNASAASTISAQQWQRTQWTLWVLRGVQFVTQAR